MVGSAMFDQQLFTVYDGFNMFKMQREHGTPARSEQEGLETMV